MSEPETKVRHPWRENIEAIAMAVVVALLFKYFILEISKIPSGSMQPTLMGDPSTQVFDRVLVDKLSFHYRDPERWEIVVFKHPLERSRIMVKRLVGLPGEELRVQFGDLWTRPDDESDWTVLRKPVEVQEELWRALDFDDPTASAWRTIMGGPTVLIDGRDIRFSGQGSVRFRADQDRIVDNYVDGYPDSIRAEVKYDPRKRGSASVGDLRVEGDVEANADLEGLVIRLSEGKRKYEFTIPGPASADSHPSVRVMDDSKLQRIENGGVGGLNKTFKSPEPFRLSEGDAVSFAAENLDDRLALSLDGEELLSVDIEPENQFGSTVTLSLEGGGGELEDLQVYRDIYYIPPTGSHWTVEIPEESYVMLGDNTLDSADSRDWKAAVWEWSDEDGVGMRQRGNFREEENPFRRSGQVRFRDEWGELHWFSQSKARPQLQYQVKLVPRDLIQGRAMAVFWPIKPHRGLWRLTWLH